MMAFGKLATGSRQLLARSIASKSQLGSLSLFSTAAPAPAAASKKPSRPSDHFGRFILPSTILPSSPAPSKVVENPTLRVALQELHKKQTAKVDSLEQMLESLRIARMPANTPAPTTVVPKENQHQQRTFQAMNRNARKPKRANHGKRPCSRIRRRFKVKRWANTSRGRG